MCTDCIICYFKNNNNNKNEINPEVDNCSKDSN